MTHCLFSFLSSFSTLALAGTDDLPPKSEARTEPEVVEVVGSFEDSSSFSSTRRALSFSSEATSFSRVSCSIGTEEASGERVRLDS